MGSCMGLTAVVICGRQKAPCGHTDHVYATSRTDGQGSGSVTTLQRSFTGIHDVPSSLYLNSVVLSPVLFEAHAMYIATFRTRLLAAACEKTARVPALLCQPNPKLAHLPSLSHTLDQGVCLLRLPGRSKEEKVGAGKTYNNRNACKNPPPRPRVVHIGGTTSILRSSKDNLAPKLATSRALCQSVLVFRVRRCFVRTMAEEKTVARIQKARKIG